MKLFIVEGDYGLPSFDYQCLQLLLTARITQQNLTVNRDIWNFPRLIEAGGRIVTDFDQMCRQLGSNIDQNLTRAQQQDKYVLINILHESILPATIYLCWVDNRNYEEVTAEWFTQTKGLFFRYICLPLHKQRAYSTLTAKFTKDQMSQIRPIIYQQFSQGCKLLATYLQMHQTSFLFGNTPTSVDVMLYGYLAPILKIPFPNNDFARAIRLRQNKMMILSNFVNVITSVYFPEIQPGEKYLFLIRRRSLIRTGHNYFALTIIAFTIFITMYGIRYDLLDYFINPHII